MTTLRENFEKLFPVPEGTTWDESRGEYVPGPFPDNFAGTNKRDNYLEHYARWQGFQAGHAAGLEDAARVVMAADGASAHPATKESCELTAAVIRAMKS